MAYFKKRLIVASLIATTFKLRILPLAEWLVTKWLRVMMSLHLEMGNWLFWIHYLVQLFGDHYANQ